MENDSTATPFGQTAPAAIDKVADSATGAIRSTQNVANSAFDSLSSTVDSARDQAVPVLERLSKQADDLTRRGIDSVRETSAQLRERAAELSDTATGHIRDEPIKAMLIAAATGAALMALITLMSRSGSGR